MRHRDGTIRNYRPDEWPLDSDEGKIIARRLPDGRTGWYAGPDAGPRSDPAAFEYPDPDDGRVHSIGRAPDGTFTINGKPVDAATRQRMLSGKP